MSEPDKWAEIAKWRLPCTCKERDGRGGHLPTCSAWYRAEVEDALREQGAEIERLRAFVGDEMVRSDYKSVADMRETIERLKESPSSRVYSHYEGCWQHPGHHACAISVAEKALDIYHGRKPSKD